MASVTARKTGKSLEWEDRRPPGKEGRRPSAEALGRHVWVWRGRCTCPPARILSIFRTGRQAGQSTHDICACIFTVYYTLVSSIGACHTLFTPHSNRARENDTMYTVHKYIHHCTLFILSLSSLTNICTSSQE